MLRTRFTAPVIAIAAWCLLPATGYAQEADSEQENDSVVESGSRITYRAVRQTGEGLGDAALSPLEDLNLRRDDIPREIAGIRTPYDPVPDLTCETIGREVRTLDTVLEIDADVRLELANRGEDGDNEDMSDRASDFALGQIASEARSIIPFRGIIRSATGANAHASRVEEAYRLAYLRRTFLKGLGMGLGCHYPAAPLEIDYSTLDENSAPIRYRAAAPSANEPYD
ncbi:hypothetical protein [Ponticaulis sp.]|uniref:hypothetical protein n=1 Tax=Ponticaulis sp. TaxID=2020902 RepID=UPI000C64DB0D|nr:hypothetical protein [Ponticaulis sp.]MAF58264.1 hypothetical protein [Ponticaulis sp.]MBN04797.1 hypothetical protein [Ponticaulis sp.]